MAGIFSEPGFGAAAVSPLENVGIAVSGTPSGSSAVVVDMENGNVLQTVNGLGTSPSAQAVAVDPVSNQAVVVDNANGTVAILSLGPAINPLQISETSADLVFGGPSAGSLALTINGSGFVSGSQVLLDNVAVPTAFVSARQVVATVPANMLAQPRRYIVQVQNPSLAASNVAGLSVVQSVAVGSAPVGIAVDTDRDLAYVTNSGDGTVSLVSLASPSPALSPLSLGTGGTVIGAPITVGTTPAGVAAFSRLGLAIVANSGSNNASVRQCRYGNSRARADFSGRYAPVALRRQALPSTRTRASVPLPTRIQAHPLRLPAPSAFSLFPPPRRAPLLLSLWIKIRWRWRPIRP